MKHLYHYSDALPRWASFENTEAKKSAGGAKNCGHKGAAFTRLGAGQQCLLLDVSGSGVIHRIWCTLSDRRPVILRSLRLDIFWDNSNFPAVSVPLGDFFGQGLGGSVAFDCECFSSPEGRSYCALLPMPFRSGARIFLVNESDTDIEQVFYDINFSLNVQHDSDVLYFHACWRRENPNVLGDDFEILPTVEGRGRFLGSNIGVITDPRYRNTWWGEGEVNVWLDGDRELPTLCGTGTEDYLGSAWGLGSFCHRWQGCSVADSALGHWAFYRYHVPDPIFFESGCRVAIQTIGGAEKAEVIELLKEKVPLFPVSIYPPGRDLLPLMEYEKVINLAAPALPDGWCNFRRQDRLRADQTSLETAQNTAVL